VHPDPNPYDSPSPPATAQSAEQLRARGRLLPVAIGLLVPSILHIVGGLFLFVYVYQVSADRDAEAIHPLIIYAMYYGITMLYCLLLATGAFSMLRRGSYLWAMTVCILALVPILGPCYVAGIPFGLWGIIVLRRPEVRASFAKL
jgi:uncharacterized membrane protein